MPIMPSAVPPHHLNFSEYLSLETASNSRHELIAGEWRAMAGATEAHVKISGNVFAALWQHLRDSPCSVYASDMKLKAGPDCYYPDVFVSCAPEDNDPLVKKSPLLIVEVLSDSTESLDKGRKLVSYLNLPSLREYALISQDQMEVMVYHNTPAGWDLEIIRQSGEIAFSSIGLRLPVSSLYAKVGLSP